MCKKTVKFTHTRFLRKLAEPCATGDGACGAGLGSKVLCYFHFPGTFLNSPLTWRSSCEHNRPKESPCSREGLQQSPRQQPGHRPAQPEFLPQEHWPFPGFPDTHSTPFRAALRSRKRASCSSQNPDTMFPRSSHAIFMHDQGLISKL